MNMRATFKVDPLAPAAGEAHDVFHIRVGLDDIFHYLELLPHGLEGDVLSGLDGSDEPTGILLG